MNRLTVAAILCCLAVALSACAKKGPLEQAGAKVDETVRTIKNGGEKTTGDKINDAAHDVSKDVEKAADDLKK
jgi:predicted small lipoprotein YifL